ncbi:polygalacturonase [Rhizobium paknamense]|uniref:Polygalacturonase n=2 Tax=Rhizobium paknamense TaxID=1206817 RepID=A0ABU0IHX4_9HYPH|nr:polygalacturonase [Rhizobium paknamense]
MTRKIAPRDGDNTAAIQDAVHAVSAAGGGEVVLEAGLHTVRGLRLASGVNLVIGKGAVLRPVPDYEAYAETRVDVIAEKSDRAMIVARGAENVSLTGEGVIEAGGEGFIIGNDEAVGTLIPAELRPRVLVMEHCRNVRVSGVTVKDSPMWTLHFVNCEGLHVSHVTVENNRRLPNTDGMVLDACRQALVEHCVIVTADDGICLKTSAGPDGKAIGTCENVAVRHSSVSSLSCALKLGTESHGDFTNIVFEDCKVVDSNRGLGIFSRDGGRVSNVRFSRIALDCRETPDGFWGSGEALTVTVVDRRPEKPAGAVVNLLVEDVTGVMEGAITAISTSAAGIHNLRLSRVRVRQRPGVLGTGQRYDLRPTNADLAVQPDEAGRANAYRRGADGRIIGLEDYPGGLPGLYTEGVKGMALLEVEIDRPEPLPMGWNSQTLLMAAE